MESVTASLYIIKYVHTHAHVLYLDMNPKILEMEMDFGDSNGL